MPSNLILRLAFVDQGEEAVAHLCWEEGTKFSTDVDWPLVEFLNCQVLACPRSDLSAHTNSTILTLRKSTYQS